MLIVEKTRNQLVSDSKKSAKERGDNKTRYEKRLKSRVGSSLKYYNNMDMNKFFKENILDVNIQVIGETDTYLVRLSFGGILDNLQRYMRNKDKLELKDVIRAVITSFNSDNVYVSCSCPDWKYRQNFWATKKGINSGTPELRPSKETNPDDTMGDGCKHVMLLLGNISWIIKVSRVIYNYIIFMKQNKPRLYADFIYPAIYNKEYEEPVQLDMDTTDELASDSDTLDFANKQARERGRFKPGNTYGVRFAPNDDKQQKFDLDGEEEND